MTPFWSTERGHPAVNFTVRLLVGAICAIVPHAPAAAQVTMPPETTRGLFGSTPHEEAKTQLDLRASVIEGYDSDVTTALISTVDPGNLQSGGFSTMLDTGAMYAWRGKTQVVANVNSVLRHYSDFGTTQSLGHRAGIGVTKTTVGGMTLLANQSAAFSPTYFYNVFPGTSGTPLEVGSAGVTAPNYTVSDFASYTYTTMMSLSHTIGPRSSVAATGQFFYTNRVQETENWSDVSNYNVGGRYSRNTTRNLALSTELQYRSGEYGHRAEGITTEVALNFGVEYTRPFSATRRATMGVHVGVSGADYPGSEIGLAGFQRRYRTIGDASLSYPFSQNWTATGSIRRGLEYVSDLPTPVVSNGATTSVTGLLTHRVDMNVLVGYASGESILSSQALVFDTYTSSVRVRYAVSRTFAIFAEYFRYYYDFKNGVLLPPGMPPGLDRKGGRAGLTLWMPAVRR